MTTLRTIEVKLALSMATISVESHLPAVVVGDRIWRLHDLTRLNSEGRRLVRDAITYLRSMRWLISRRDAMGRRCVLPARSTRRAARSGPGSGVGDNHTVGSDA